MKIGSENLIRFKIFLKKIFYLVFLSTKEKSGKDLSPSPVFFGFISILLLQSARKNLRAGVVKLVDALDSKSSRGNPVGVRFPPPA